MTAPARRFYRRYYLSLRLLYTLTASLFAYGLAWALLQSAHFCRWPLLVLPLALLIPFSIGFSYSLQLIHWLCFAYTGLPKRQRELGSAERELVPALLAADPVAADWKIRLVELGEVSYLGVASGQPAALWISSYTMQRMPPDALRCMVLHEAGHVALRHQRSWLTQPLTSLALAVPLAVCLSNGWWLAVAAVIHAWLLLRWQAWLSKRQETAADHWAAQRAGRLAYARALARYLRDFEEQDSAHLREQRLERLGCSKAQIGELVALSDLDGGSPAS